MIPADIGEGGMNRSMVHENVKSRTKSAALRELFPTSAWSPPMAFVGHGKRWSIWFTTLIANIFVRSCYPQYTNFRSLSDKAPVIVSAVISVYASGKKRERDQSSASPHKTPSRTRPLKWGNIRVTLIWAKFQILFSKLLSALENKSDSRKSETEVFKPWKLDAFLLYAFSDHRLMSKFDHKNHSGSLIFSLMACF